MNRIIPILFILLLSISFGLSHAALTGNPNPPIVSNAVVDIGQYTFVNTIVTGGFKGYTANYLWIAPNTINNGKFGNTISSTASNAQISGVPANDVLQVYLNSATLIQFATSLNGNTQIGAGSGTGAQNQFGGLLVGVWTVNSVIVDSNGVGSNVLVTSANTFQVNPALVAAAPTFTNVIIDIGQKTLLTSQPSGGTPSYSYQWYTNYGSTATCSGTGNSISGATSSTYLASPTTSNAYAYQVTDSASTPYVLCSSAANEITVPALTTPTLLISNTSTSTGQYVTAFANVIGGQPPYSYNFQLSNTVNGVITNTIYTGNTFTSNSFTFQITKPETVNSPFLVNVVVTDSASTNDITNSVYSHLITASTNNGILTFSGYTWNVVQCVTNACGLVPGYPYTTTSFWKNQSTDYVDANGVLHMKESAIMGIVYAGQLNGQNAFGYGTYTYNVLGLNDGGMAMNQVDPFATAAVFAYNYSTPLTGNNVFAREMDFFETLYNSGGNHNQADTNVQPAGQPGGQTVYNIPTTNGLIITATWLAGYEHTEIVDEGSGNVIVNFVYTGANVPVPSANQIINLWHVSQGSVTTFATPQYLNISSFTFSNSLISVNPNPPQISNAIVDVGQYTFINTIVQNSMKGFTENWFFIAPRTQNYGTFGNTITATIANTPPANDLLEVFVNSNTLLQMTVGLPTNGLTNQNFFGANVLGSWQFNTLVIDSNGLGTAEAVSLPASLQINSDPTFTLSTSNSAIDAGQWTTFTITVNGGTGAFNVELYNVTGGAQQGTNVIIQQGGSNTISFKTGAVGTFNYNAIGYDEGTSSPFTFNSLNQPITVHAAQVPTLYFSNSVLDSNQFTTLTVSVVGGVAPRTFSFYNTTSGTAVPIAACQNQVGTGSNMCSFQTSSLTNGNIFSYNAVVTDSATSINTTNTITNSFTVNAVLSLPTISASQYPFVNTGASEVFNAFVSGGTLPYTYNFQVFNSITNVLIANQLGTSNGFVWTVSSSLGTTFSANVLVKDQATTPATTNSLKIVPAITVANIVFGLTPANGFVILGQNDTWVASLSGGGTLPLTYNWIVLNQASTQIGGQSNQNVFAFTNVFTFQPNMLGNIVVSASVNDPTTFSSSYNVIVPLELENQSNSIYSINPSGYVPPAYGACSNNFIGGYCTGNVIYTMSMNLIKDIYVNGNLTINSGQTLTTNGFNIYVSNQFVNKGTINTGTLNNGGLEGALGVNGGNVPLSYGGSGGGGSSGYGGYTLSAGGTPGANNGGNVVMPTLTNANILVWYTNGMVNYLNGAGAGAGNSCIAGGGGYGVYIQAQNVIAGTINSNGILGGNCGGAGQSGGSGAGAVVIAYNALNGGYTAGTYNTGGGAGVPADSGAGGGSAVYVINYVTQPIPVLRFNWYYPYSFYTAGGNSTISYSLNQTFNGVTTVLQTGNNINYIPLTTQQSGLYKYGLQEEQGTAGFGFNYTYVFVNMTDVQNSIRLNSPIIQYFTNIANFSKGTFPVSPISWKLWSYPATYPLAYGINTIQGSVFSSSLASIPVNVQLTYPLTSFNISLINNPSVQTTLTLNAFQVSNTAANILTQQIYTINSFSEPAFTPLNVVTKLSAVALFNNYTINLNYTTISANIIELYIPSSNFINPSFILTNQTFTSTNSLYATRVNNFFNYPQNTQVTTQQWQTLNVYLANTLNVSFYQVNIFQCVGFANNFYIQSLYEGNTKIQQSLLTKTSSGIALQLLTNQPYSLKIFSALGSLIYASATQIFSPTVATVIYLPCNQTVPITPQPNIQVSCYSNTIGLNAIGYCVGNDTKDLVSGWVVNFTNQSTLFGTVTTINSVTINGNSFSTSFVLPSNTINYHAKVTAKIGNVIDPEYIYGFQLSTNAPPNLPISNYIIAFMFALLPVVLAYYHRTALMILELVVIWLGSAIGVFNFDLGILGGLTVLIVIMILIDERGSQ